MTNNRPTEHRAKLEQVLGIACLALLLLASFVVMRPFISSLLWALVLSFSLWPIQSRLTAALRGRPTISALIITGILGLLMVLPFLVVGLTLADNVQDITNAVRRWFEAGPPEPPQWLAKIPLVGARAAEEWQALAADTSGLFKRAKVFLEPVSLWMLKSGFTLGRGFLELALSIVISFFILRDGSALADRLSAGVARIAGSRGERLLGVAGKTVRGVVYGIIGTAMIQAMLAAVGFLIAGVPGVPLLALLTFVLCMIPAVGAPLVWLPAALWLFHQDASGRAIFLIIWGIGVSSVDNFVKPWLISHGSNMPFLLVFFGALGGLAAFGFIGLFIGPTVLAIAYKLIQEWFASKRVVEPEIPAAVP